MSRKHYESLAAVVRNMRAAGVAEPMLHLLVAQLAEVCREHSGRSINGHRLFDEDRFRAACWKGLDRMAS